jgi:hypothetical protein
VSRCQPQRVAACLNPTHGVSLPVYRASWPVQAKPAAMRYTSIFPVSFDFEAANLIFYT